MSTTHYVGKWCFDETIRNIRGDDVEIVCGYGNNKYGYYVEWQYDKRMKKYNLLCTKYNDFYLLQDAQILKSVSTYEELVTYCMWSSPD